MAEYGFLDRLYPSKNLKEISNLPRDFQNAVREFSDNENIYLRFYSISPEFEGQTVYEAFHLITMGYVTEVSLRASDAEYKISFFNKMWMDALSKSTWNQGHWKPV